MPARPGEWIAIALGLILIASTFRDYGITTDEALQSEYGEKVVDYFASGFRDRSCNEIADLKIYGPPFESLAALAYRPIPGWKYEVRHLLSALMGLLTIPPVMRLAGLCGGRGAVPFAAAGLALMPQFYGHAFNNSKDIPLACLFSWSMLMLARIFAEGKAGWKEALGCALAFGLTMAVRPASDVLLAGIFCLVFAASAWNARGQSRGGTVPLSGAKIAAIVALSWSIMVLPWPWAHLDPIRHPAQAIHTALKFHSAYPIVFDGSVRWSDELPRRYLIQTLAITTPPFILLVAAVGIGAILRDLARDRQDPGTFAGGLVLAWFAGPLLLWALGRSNIYDGMRHFLFVLPALAVLFGRGAASILGACRGPKSLILFAAATAAGIAGIVAEMVRLHPYQMTYHNAFADGLAGAGRRYDTDYWRSSYKEAMEWINRQPPGPSGKTRVLVSADPRSLICAKWYQAGHVESAYWIGHRGGEIPEGFDYAIASVRVSTQVVEPAGDPPWDGKIPPPPEGIEALAPPRPEGPYTFLPNFPGESFRESPIVHRVGRDGADFCVIRRRARPSPASPSAD